MHKLSKKEQAEILRQTVDTVGQPGKPGEGIQKVISVGMLSEGWDAKTVTHIIGLRAFSSQLLCEQVVGRGLRRTSYEVNPTTGLFDAEYVNIFGVPFTFLPHESQDGPPPPPPSPKTRIESVKEKQHYEINWCSIFGKPFGSKTRNPPFPYLIAIILSAQPGICKRGIQESRVNARKKVAYQFLCL